MLREIQWLWPAPILHRSLRLSGWVDGRAQRTWPECPERRADRPVHGMPRRTGRRLKLLAGTTGIAYGKHERPS